MTVLDEKATDIEREVAELRRQLDEAHAQQAASDEILQVINSSPGDLASVFNAILDKAHTLCGVAHGSLQLYDGEKFHAVAVHGLPEALAERLIGGYSPNAGTPAYKLLDGEPFVHVADLAEIDMPLAQEVVKLGGTRTHLWVALRKEGNLLGQIVAARKEVRPFSDKEIALLQNFAAQAVIAMENARLITETREALEQQTATAEVLGVINSSPADLAPVFDALLERATRLCSAAFGIMNTFDGDKFHVVAVHQLPPLLEQFHLSEPSQPGLLNPLRRIADGDDLIHIDDLRLSEAYQEGEPRVRAMVESGDARSLAIVALRKDARLLGTITVYRQEVRPFEDKQIALLQNFAAQAVIAMENARLITETREALEQQTATAEVLGVINASPGDLTPVFDAMLERALQLCEAGYGGEL
jgi:GAF domain-containing protein